MKTEKQQMKIKYWLGSIIIAIGIMGLIGRYEIGMSVISLYFGIYLRRKTICQK